MKTGKQAFNSRRKDILLKTTLAKDALNGDITLEEVKKILKNSYDEWYVLYYEPLSKIKVTANNIKLIQLARGLSELCEELQKRVQQQLDFIDRFKVELETNDYSSTEVPDYFKEEYETFTAKAKDYADRELAALLGTLDFALTEDPKQVELMKQIAEQDRKIKQLSDNITQVELWNIIDDIK